MQEALDIFRQQQLGGFATRASNTANGRALLIGIFQEA
jgi:hypothetical protein